MPIRKRFLLFLSAFLAFSLLVSVRPAQADGAKYYRSGRHGSVCLTVDDGYGRKNIQTILDTLRANRVNCTFFIIGSALKLNGDLWRQAVKDGNDICYHTMHHTNLLTMSNTRVQRDLDEWNRTLARVVPGYQSPKLARFPGGNGASSRRLLALFARNGYKVVGWSIDMHVSIRRDPNHIIANHIERLARPNSIILIHFNGWNANALPYYIGWLRSRFTLSKVSMALADGGPVALADAERVAYRNDMMYWHCTSACNHIPVINTSIKPIHYSTNP